MRRISCAICQRWINGRREFKCTEDTHDNLISIRNQGYHECRGNDGACGLNADRVGCWSDVYNCKRDDDGPETVEQPIHNSVSVQPRSTGDYSDIFCGVEGFDMTVSLGTVDFEALLMLILEFPSAFKNVSFELDGEPVTHPAEGKGSRGGCSPGMLSGAHVLIPMKLYSPFKLPIGKVDDSIIVLESEEWPNGTFAHKAIYICDAERMATRLREALLLALTAPDSAPRELKSPVKRGTMVLPPFTVCAHIPS